MLYTGTIVTSVARSLQKLPGYFECISCRWLQFFVAKASAEGLDAPPPRRRAPRRRGVQTGALPVRETAAEGAPHPAPTRPTQTAGVSRPVWWRLAVGSLPAARAAGSAASRLATTEQPRFALALHGLLCVLQR